MVVPSRERNVNFSWRLINYLPIHYGRDHLLLPALQMTLTFAPHENTPIKVNMSCFTRHVLFYRTCLQRALEGTTRTWKWSVTWKAPPTSAFQLVTTEVRWFVPAGERTDPWTPVTRRVLHHTRLLVTTGLVTSWVRFRWVRFGKCDQQKTKMNRLMSAFNSSVMPWFNS